MTIEGDRGESNGQHAEIGSLNAIFAVGGLTMGSRLCHGLWSKTKTKTKT